MDQLPPNAGYNIGDVVVDDKGTVRTVVRCPKCNQLVRALFAPLPDTVQTCPKCGYKHTQPPPKAA